MQAPDEGDLSSSSLLHHAESGGGICSLLALHDAEEWPVLVLDAVPEGLDPSVWDSAVLRGLCLATIRHVCSLVASEQCCSHAPGATAVPCLQHAHWQAQLEAGRLGPYQDNWGSLDSVLVGKLRRLHFACPVPTGSATVTSSGLQPPSGAGPSQHLAEADPASSVRQCQSLPGQPEASRSPSATSLLALISPANCARLFDLGGCSAALPEGETSSTRLCGTSSSSLDGISSYASSAISSSAGGAVTLPADNVGVRAGCARKACSPALHVPRQPRAVPGASSSSR